MRYFLIVLLFVSQIAFADVEKMVIIGAGAAGSSAAIFAAQADMAPLVLQDTDCNAQMALIHEIDNYPGSLDNIEGVELMHNFRLQAEGFGARFIEDSVKEVDLLSKPFKIELASGNTVYAESVIIASGTTKRWLNLPNEQALKGKGIVAATFCKGTDYTDKNVAVVGAGHAALQEAIYIADKAKKITILNRNDKFAASKFHQNAVFSHANIDVLYNTEVEEIIGDDKVTGIQLKNNKTKESQAQDIDLIIVAIGNKPNTEVFAGQLDLGPSGNIVINGKNTSTSIPGVFAAGDVTDVAYGRVVIAAGQGAMAGLDAVRYLDSHK